MTDSSSDLRLDVIFSGILQASISKSSSSLHITHLADLERTSLSGVSTDKEKEMIQLDTENVEAAFLDVLSLHRSEILVKLVDIHGRIVNSPFKKQKEVIDFWNFVLDFSCKILVQPTIFRVEVNDSHPLLGSRNSVIQYLLFEKKRPSHFLNFFDEVLARAIQIGMIDDIIHQLLEELTRRMILASRRSDNTYLILCANLLHRITSHKSVAESVVRCGFWFGNRNAAGINRTILGLLLSSSISLEEEPEILLLAVFELVLRLLKHGGDPKEAILEYFSLLAALNPKASSPTFIDSEMTSRDILFNSSLVFLKLSMPFVSANKVALVDEKYMYRSRIPLYLSSSALGLTEEEVKSHLSKGDGFEGGEVKFVTECFFITNCLLNIGIFPLIGQAKLMETELHRFSSSLNHVSSRPNLAVLLQKRIDELRKKKDLVLDVLMKGFPKFEFLDSILHFISFFSRWFAMKLDPRVLGRDLTSADIDPCILLLPEFMFQNMSDFVIFLVAHNNFKFLQNATVVESIFRAVFYSIHPNEFFKNPYIPANLLNIVEATLRVSRRPSPDGKLNPLPVVENVLLSSFMTSYAVNSLLKFYVRVESTGSSTQFYDKINIRHHITTILLYLLSIREHSTALRELHGEHDFFLRLIHLLMNDSIYLLDEMIEKLRDIHGIEEKILTKNDMEQSEIQELQSEYFALQNIAPTMCTLTVSTLELLVEFAGLVPEAFVVPENIHRVAEMLNYYISILAGPKYQTLKVRNPEKYSFRPKTILRCIIVVYLRLMKVKEFMQAVVDDGRSYSMKLFEQTARLIKMRGIVGIAESEAFDSLVGTLSGMDSGNEEISYEGAPEEFLDSITFNLMDNPVRLPSGNTVDRAVISRILLSDPMDPFTRQHLTKEMLVPDDELKARIDEYKNQTKKKG